MKIRDVAKDGAVVNPHSSDFNDDELLNIAAGGGGERMGTRMLAAELLAMRDRVLNLKLMMNRPETTLEDVRAEVDLILDEPMFYAPYGPRFEAGE